MTEKRRKQLIDAYIPNLRDESLGIGEYYYKQETTNGPRILRVVVREIFPYKDGTEYGIYQEKGNRLVRVDSGYCDPLRGVQMHALYDNKQDCRDDTHYMYDGWEELRKL